MAANASPNAHRSPTPKPPVQRNQSNQRQQSKANNSGNNSNASAVGGVGNLAQTAALNNHRSNLTQAVVEHLHNMQQFSHTHQNLQHAVDYINLPQISQNYGSSAGAAAVAAAAAAAGNSYDLVGMPSVLQQRMSMNNNANSSTNPLASQTPSTACAVNNFYLQNSLANDARGLSSVSHGTTSPASVGSQNAQGSNGEQHQQQQQQQQMLQNNGNNNNNMSGNDVGMAGQQGSATTSNTNTGVTNTNTQMVGNLCSLSKLQQLTNGLDIQQPCNTPPSVGSGQVNLTPPPSSHHAIPHNSMTPPPHLLVPQNRNLSTPPTTMLQSAQMTPIQYHKYYSSNMNIGPISAAVNNAGGGGGSKQQSGVVGSRNTPSAPLQHISAAAAATTSTSPATVSRTGNNVHLSSNLMTPYASSINSYRMTAQQQPPPPPPTAAGYTPGSEYANSQLPMQMGVMQASQYDACAIQRAAAQQNSMYSTYSPYIPLNGPMRR